MDGQAKTAAIRFDRSRSFLDFNSERSDGIDHRQTARTVDGSIQGKDGRPRIGWIELRLPRSRELLVGLTPEVICHNQSGFMTRSVVLTGTRRCDRCRLAHRWCICGAFQAVECPFALDVLIHHREFMRPTSTGRLIGRVIPKSRQHLFRREAPPAREDIVRPGCILWILHPRGEPLPTAPMPAGLQVLLLDASWPEASRMTQTVAPWGKLYRLPMVGPSRNRLRGQELSGNYSTIEALLFLLAALGLTPAEAALRLQFELHVYAGLRARGSKAAALEFLATSPILAAFPDLLKDFDRRRPDYQKIEESPQKLD